MIFSIAIYSAPGINNPAEKAFKFAKELLNQGHSIYRLFFFNDGVLNCANSNQALLEHWQQLITENKLDAICCIASAEKRGLKQSADHVNLSETVHPIFNIGGIAQLVDATAHSDRIITFAG